MMSSRKCAVAASAFPEGGRQIRAWLEEAGFSEVICVTDGRAALDALNRCIPDALIADAVLPGLDGPSLAERICGLPLTVYPATVLLTLPGLPVRRNDAAFAVMEKPGSVQLLSEALERMSPVRRPVAAPKRALAEKTLRAVGVPEHCGRDYLLRAVEMVWLDARLLKGLTGRLYPAVASCFGVEPRHAERAMRHVIDVAWRSGEIEAQYKLFGDTIDASRGCPTCGEMIAQIADILRWEGKA